MSGADAELAGRRIPFVTPFRLDHAQRIAYEAACRTILDRSAYRVGDGWSDRAATLLGPAIGLAEDDDGWAVSMFRSGTDALVRGLLACGVHAGDHVAIPDLAFHAVASSVLLIGAVPVPIDVRADDWCLDPEALRATCAPGSVAAVIAVDNYGTPCDWPAIADVTRRIGARLIVDACESLGATRPDGPVVHHADCVVVSFSFTKPIHAAGMGGALAVRREVNAGYDPVRWTDSQCALPELNAAHLVLGWPSLGDNVARLRANYARYAQLAERTGLVTQVEHGTSTRIHAPLLLTPELALHRDALLVALDAAGISCRAQFASQAELLELGEAPPVSRDVAARVVSLPTGAGLPIDDVEHVATAVAGVLAGREFATTS